MTSPVLAALAQARFRAAPAFARWCELNGASFCPAAPAIVARFVRDCAALGIGRLWPAIQDISKLHVSLGLADPTLGGTGRRRDRRRRRYRAAAVMAGRLQTSIQVVAIRFAGLRHRT